jgi:CRISPR-associated endoribonuclease Cas6
MPSTWSVELAGPSEADIPAEAPHAVVTRWLDADHKAPVKPYSIAPPQRGAGRVLLRVNLLDDGLSDRLRDGVRPGTPVRLGQSHFTVEREPVFTRTTGWNGVVSGPTATSWDVTFVSPTTFRRHGRTSPWPAPESVLTSLTARWLGSAPPHLADLPRVAPGTLWVSDIDGHSVPFMLRGTLVSGFVGRIRYVLDQAAPESDASQVSAMMRFAEYAGVGSHTAFGLGVVTVVPHSSPTPGPEPGRSGARTVS